MFHIQHVKAQKGQRTYVKSAKQDFLVMSEVSSVLSMEAQVLRAETIQALNVVSATFLLAWLVCLTESTCETRKKNFYFTSKTLFILEIIKF